MTVPTFATVRSAYHDNADYDVENSVAKARLFVVACRRLKEMTPSASNDGGGSLEDEPRKYEADEKNALAFIASHVDSAPVRHVDLSNLRN